jgi:hypothetical protein
MARKNIKKHQEVKVDKKTKKTNSNFFSEAKNNKFYDKTKKKENLVDKKTTKKEIKDKLETITDEHVVTKYNQKLKVLNDISTIDGTLHKGEIVTVENLIGENIKVIDNVGRYWFVNPRDISTNL